MRIGYVLKKFPRISETFILSEILELQRQGHEVTVFSLHRPDDGVFHAQLAELAQPVVYLPTRKSAAALDNLRAKLPMIRAGLDGLWSEFEDLISNHHPAPWSILNWGLDVAEIALARRIEHLHAHFATVASHVARAAHSISKIPFSFTCHAKDIYRETVQPERFQSLARPAAFVVTVCEANREHIETNLAGAEPLSVVTLYNGVDLNRLQPGTRNGDATPLILGVGRLVEKKGFHFLVEAASRLRRDGVKFRCVIIGEGEERPQLEALIRAADPASPIVELAGIQTQDEVREMLERADVLALPCVIGADGNRDALPTVLLEALACGVACVTTPIAGNAEIVDNGSCGVLVPPGDTDALTEALRNLLGDTAQRREFATRGRARAERLFDLNKNVATLASYFASHPSPISAAR